MFIFGFGLIQVIPDDTTVVQSKSAASGAWSTENALRSLYRHTQNFRKQVEASEISEALASVHTAQEDVRDSLYEIWDMVSQRKADLPSNINRAVFNKDADAIYVKLGRWADTDKVLKANLIQPRTAFKKKRSMQGMWSSNSLEESLDAYR